jgi:hypothetical protein
MHEIDGGGGSVFIKEMIAHGSSGADEPRLVQIKLCTPHSACKHNPCLFLLFTFKVKITPKFAEVEVRSARICSRLH